MKILITGSCGFISGYLIEELLKYNHTIVGIDNYSEKMIISKIKEVFLIVKDCQKEIKKQFIHLRFI